MQTVLSPACSWSRAVNSSPFENALDNFDGACFTVDEFAQLNVNPKWNPAGKVMKQNLKKEKEKY